MLKYLVIIVSILAAIPFQSVKGQLTMPGDSSKYYHSLPSSYKEPDAPKEYILGAVSVKGAELIDDDLLIAVTGLTIGQKIKLPNDDGIQKAIKNLWKQELFSDVKINIVKFLGDKIFLEIEVEVRPKLSKYNFKGIKKSQGSELKDKIGLVRSKVVTEGVKKEAVNRIKNFFVGKGYGNATVTVLEKPDTNAVNYVILTFVVDKGEKTKINEITIVGNTQATDARLKRAMKGTKEMPRFSLHKSDDATVYENDKADAKTYFKNFQFLSLSKTLSRVDPFFRFNVLASSKYDQKKFAEDKEAIVTYYNSLGYRDARVIDDTVYFVKNGHTNIDLRIDEGSRYYFGDITWRGNTKYTDEELSRILAIKKVTYIIRICWIKNWESN